MADEQPNVCVDEQFSVINKQVSTITLGFFATPDQIGIYKVAVQMATLAAFGLQAVNTVVAPRFADLYAQNKMERLQELATGSARITLAVNMLLTILFAILGQPFFIVVFGSEFSASYLPLLILLIGQTANASTGPVAFLLNMTGHEKDTMRGIAIAAGVNILLNLLMIPQWGIQGAAAATAIATVIWNGILWWVAKKRLGINSFAVNFRKTKQ
jgi:O-antigen/teichoic acid export membrane protein